MSLPVTITTPSKMVSCLNREPSGAVGGTRILAEETPVALVYGGSTEAVMMATPSDLEDFAIGFSITEGLVETPDQIDELAVVHGSDGIELRMWLTPERQLAYRGRKRRLAGPTGCGLCGIESIAEAVKPPILVRGTSAFDARCIPDAVAALMASQSLNQETRAAHAAAFYQPGEGLIEVREDVGRHNALDKLAGALRRRSVDVAEGAIVLTSRVSVEMIQKTAVIGAPVLIAISAPTALAVRTAEASNLTLVAVARGTSSQIFTHSWRLEAY
jgi:FdhD protein